MQTKYSLIPVFGERNRWIVIDNTRPNIALCKPSTQKKCFEVVGRKILKGK